MCWRSLDACAKVTAVRSGVHVANWAFSVRLLVLNVLVSTASMLSPLTIVIFQVFNFGFWICVSFAVINFYDWDNNIVTLFKNKGNMSDCNKYRGISLLSIVGKRQSLLPCQPRWPIQAPGEDWMPTQTALHDSVIPPQHEGSRPIWRVIVLLICHP